MPTIYLLKSFHAKLLENIIFVYTFVKTNNIYICENNFRVYLGCRRAQQCAPCSNYGCGSGIHIPHIVGTQQAEL